MDRGQRRFHTMRIKCNRRRLVWEYYGGDVWWNDKPWRPTIFMSGCPKAWNKAYHIRPARRRSNFLEHLIERGVEIDASEFPDYRKPHIYYW